MLYDLSLEKLSDLSDAIVEKLFDDVERDTPKILLSYCVDWSMSSISESLESVLSQIL